MSTFTLTPSAAPSFRTRFLAAVRRYFSHSVVTRESIDQAWIDSGLERLGRSTLEDIGAPPALTSRAEQREAWKLASRIDLTRHL
jgi:nucleotidyltransferase/DNA polymerase involved in DNA repair